jgi:hypothetical protein
MPFQRTDVLEKPLHLGLVVEQVPVEMPGIPVDEDPAEVEHDGIDAGHGPSITEWDGRSVGSGPRMTLTAPRVLIGVATSVLVVGLAFVIADARSATPAEAAARSAPIPMARPPVGILIDPYTKAAAACRGLDPTILVAIHEVETKRATRGGISTAGALGPMQFLPDTWIAYGVDGDRDGTADVWDLDDALAGATHLLCANGVANEATRASAIWNYNHSWSYVRRVLERTAELNAATPS